MTERDEKLAPWPPANAEVAAKMTTLMQSNITEGRSPAEERLQSLYHRRENGQTGAEGKEGGKTQIVKDFALRLTNSFPLHKCKNTR